MSNNQGITPEHLRNLGNVPSNTDKPCNRKYVGAYTARIKNGVATCVSCGWPTKEHTS